MPNNASLPMTARWQSLARSERQGGQSWQDFGVRRKRLGRSYSDFGISGALLSVDYHIESTSIALRPVRLSAVAAGFMSRFRRSVFGIRKPNKTLHATRWSVFLGIGVFHRRAHELGVLRGISKDVSKSCVSPRDISTQHQDVSFCRVCQCLADRRGGSIPRIPRQLHFVFQIVSRPCVLCGVVGVPRDVPLEWWRGNPRLERLPQRRTIHGRQPGRRVRCVWGRFRGIGFERLGFAEYGCLHCCVLWRQMQIVGVGIEEWFV